MEIIEDLLKILLPAALVMYAMYLAVNTLLTKAMEKIKSDEVLKHKETVLPVRLQAYERLCLYLERITPSNLVLRVNDPSFNVSIFRQQLVSSVREEYNHNLAQQVYVSDEAWNLIRNATEDVLGLVNAAAKSLDGEKPGQELGLLILQLSEEKPVDNINNALAFTKEEIRQLF